MSIPSLPSFAAASRACSLVLSALLVGACSGSDPVQPGDPCDVGAPQLEVSGGTRPTFTWSPACGAGHLEVVDVTPGSDGQVMWMTGDPMNGKGLVPPVRYPERAPGEAGFPEPLVSGRQYRVRAWRWEFTGSGVCLENCPTATLWTSEATFVP